MADPWETHKEEIRTLYIEQGRTCKVVAQEMKRRYGFEPSLGQYQTHLDGWGFRKNLKDAEWPIVLRSVEKRQKEQGKNSVLSIPGKPVSPKKLKKESSRHPASTWEKHKREADGQADVMPNGVVIWTPPQSRRGTPRIRPIIPVFVDSLPYFRFQNSMVQNVPAFEGIVRAFSSISVGPQALVPQGSQVSRIGWSGLSDGIAPLTKMSQKDLRLVQLFGNVLPCHLVDFMTVVARLCNNDRGTRTFHLPQSLAGIFSSTLIKMYHSRQGRSAAQAFFSQKGPYTESLMELLFAQALQEDRADVAMFLLRHSNITTSDAVVGFSDLPLHVAIECGATSTVKALLQIGARLNPRRSGLLSALAKEISLEELRDLCEQGLADFPEAIIKLVPWAEVGLTKMWLGRATRGHFFEPFAAEVALAVSLRHEKLELARHLMKEGVQLTKDGFREAVRAGEYEIVREGLSNRMDPNCLNSTDNYHLSTLDLRLLLDIAVSKDNLDMASLLLDFGADANGSETPTSDRHPVLTAVRNGSMDMLKLLLKRGAEFRRELWDHFSLYCFRDGGEKRQAGHGPAPSRQWRRHLCV